MVLRKKVNFVQISLENRRESHQFDHVSGDLKIHLAVKSSVVYASDTVTYNSHIGKQKSHLKYRIPNYRVKARLHGRFFSF